MSTLPYFAKVLPDGRWALYLDNHLISTFSECEKKFYYRHMLMIQPKARSSAVSIGGWWARVMEDFYGAFESKSATQSFLLEQAMLRWRELSMDALENEDPTRFEKFGGLKGALLMCNEYFEKYAGEDTRRWRIISVELGFGLKNEVLLGENNKVVVFYCGRPDKLIYDIVDNYVAPVDDKTVDAIPWNVHVKYKPFSQFAGYVFAVNKIVEDLGIADRKADRCIVNVCGRLPAGKTREGKVKERFVRVYSPFSQADIDEWQINTLRKATRLRAACEADAFVMNEQACHLYSGCIYRMIDSQHVGQDRQRAIELGYVHVEPWKPYELQEETEK